MRAHARATPEFDAGLRSEDAEEAVLSACSSLVAVVYPDGYQHGVVQFCHFSVKEFLTSSHLATSSAVSRYHVLPEPANAMLAQACLSILLEYGNQSHEFRKTDFPLADYAAEHWVDHAKFGNVSVVIQDGMERLFDPERPQFAAWIWLYDMENPKKTLSGYYPRRPEITSLYYAVLCGFPRPVEHLINIRPQDIHARGGSYSTPLHAALAKGHPQVARLLVLSGADTSSLDNHVRVPLHAASQNGRLDIARLLLDRGANIDAQDREGKTPLFLALDDGRVDVARLLLERGANAKSRSKHGWTPLHAVSGNGCPDIVPLLLERGADINAQDFSRQTPLSVALLGGKLEVARLLLGRGANPNFVDRRGRTPLHIATENGYSSLVRLLLDHGAEVNIENWDHKTPLFLGLETKVLEAARLLWHGANVNTRDKCGNTPIHIASQKGPLEIVPLLLDRDVDVNIKDWDHKTPLAIAVNTESSISHGC